MPFAGDLKQAVPKRLFKTHMERFVHLIENAQICRRQMGTSPSFFRELASTKCIGDLTVIGQLEKGEKGVFMIYHFDLVGPSGKARLIDSTALQQSSRLLLIVQNESRLEHRQGTFVDLPLILCGEHKVIKELRRDIRAERKKKVTYTQTT